MIPAPQDQRRTRRIRRRNRTHHQLTPSNPSPLTLTLTLTQIQTPFPPLTHGLPTAKSGTPKQVSPIPGDAGLLTGVKDATIDTGPTFPRCTLRFLVEGEVIAKRGIFRNFETEEESGSRGEEEEEEEENKKRDGDESEGAKGEEKGEEN
ncbi:hypothetical protein H4I96_01448 [Botrytis cinerea]